jgi:hypothetical protein
MSSLKEKQSQLKKNYVEPVEHFQGIPAVYGNFDILVLSVCHDNCQSIWKKREIVYEKSGGYSV